MPHLLEADRLIKRFGPVTAVDDLSLAVGEGEALALLGPNGAGKTTLLRMLVGIFRPDHGTIGWHVDGARRAAMPRERLGYLPEERGLHQDMPVRRTLGFFGALRGMTRGDAERAALPWLERVGLADRADQPVKTLSKGNQQKVQFVAAVLHRPRVAFLDEPFSGLDPVNQDLFTTLIRELREGGTTVVFSAHQMPLVERLADRIFLVARGRCVLEGTVAELRSRWHAGERLVLGVAAGDPRVLLAHPAVEAVEEGRAAGEVRLRLRDGIGMAGLLGMIDERLTVTSLRTEAVSLHDIYVQAVGGEAAGAPPEMPRGGGSPPSPLAEHAILPPSIPTPDARPTAAGAR